MSHSPRITSSRSVEDGLAEDRNTGLCREFTHDHDYDLGSGGVWDSLGSCAGSWPKATR